MCSDLPVGQDDARIASASIITEALCWSTDGVLSFSQGTVAKLATIFAGDSSSARALVVVSFVHYQCKVIQEGPRKATESKVGLEGSEVVCLLEPN